MSSRFASRQWPRISIVTPSYNQGHFLEETITSILDQDYPNLEYIIIDGGSSDNSLEIIKKYEHRIDYWTSEPDRGQGDAIIKGFMKASGEIWAWQNSDDRYGQSALERVAEHFLANPHIELLFGGWRVIDTDGRPFSEHRYRRFSMISLRAGLQVPTQPAAFFKRRAYDRVGGIDPRWHQTMDYDLYVRIANKHNVAIIPDILGDFRIHADSKTVSDRKGQFAEMKSCRALRLHPSTTERAFWFLCDGMIGIRDDLHRRTGVYSFRESLAAVMKNSRSVG
jgi:glycosyltransferase involved in cell wall biosynthesis